MLKLVISLPNLQMPPIPASQRSDSEAESIQSVVVVSCFDLHQSITVDDCAFDKSRTVVILW